VTMLPTPNPKPPTMYFRREFTLTPEQLALDTGYLVARARFDDGIVIHINGEEFWRGGMPDGNVTYNTLANVTQGGAGETTYVESMHNFKSLNLRERNVIAVEVHQSSLSSADSHFDVLLSVDVVPYCFGNLRPGENSVIDFEDDGINVHRLRRSYLGLDYFYWERPGVDVTQSMRLPVVTFDSKVWRVDDAAATLVTSQVDVRNFKSVSVSVDVATEAEDPLEVIDTLDVSIFSLSAISGNYEKIPWLSAENNSSGELLVGEGATKRIRVPESEIDEDNGWNVSLDFDDLAWREGEGGVGFEGFPTSTTSYSSLIGIDVQAEMEEVNPSVYIRIPFVVGDLAEVDEMFLRMRFDDGFVAWLNGVRVASHNAPEMLSWDAAASSLNPDTQALMQRLFDVTPFIPLLVTGENLLAIQAMNQTAASADFLCSPSLSVNDTAVNATRFNVGALRSQDGRMRTFVTPPGLIPDEATSILVKVTADMANSGSALYVDNIRIAGELIEADSFDALGGDLLAVDGDFDRDGVGDFVEYALSGDPFAAGGTRMPEFSVGALGYATFRFPQMAGEVAGDVDRGMHIRDVRYRAQFSTDAVTWRDGLGEPLFLEDSLEGGMLTLRTRRPVVLEGEAGFFRLFLEKLNFARGVHPCGDPGAVTLSK
jgi:hypothetical protein